MYVITNTYIFVGVKMYIRIRVLFSSLTSHLIFLILTPLLETCIYYGFIDKAMSNLEKKKKLTMKSLDDTREIVNLIITKRPHEIY